MEKACVSLFSNRKVGLMSDYDSSSFVSLIFAGLVQVGSLIVE